MDFWKGAIMKPADVLELTGQTVLPETFSVHPTGNLIHVLLEEEPNFLKSLRKSTKLDLEIRDDPIIAVDEFRLVSQPAGRDVTEQYAVA